MSSRTPDSSTDLPTRRSYKGACHCGLTRYILHLTLPPPPSSLTTPSPTAGGPQRIYKCNCSVCVKAGFFHVRPGDAPGDFLVLGPLLGDEAGEVGDREGEGGEKKAGFQAATGLKMGLGGLQDYTVFKKQIHWYFCTVCGVRCFAFSGLSEIFNSVDEEGRMVRAWRPMREGWTMDETGYLSVNACTLELNRKEDGGKGLGLREWHERGWIAQMDCKNWAEEERWGRPYEGGMY